MSEVYGIKFKDQAEAIDALCRKLFGARPVYDAVVKNVDAEWRVVEQRPGESAVETGTGILIEIYGGKTIGEELDLLARIARLPQLERELAEAREQRDRLADALKSARRHILERNGLCKDGDRGAALAINAALAAVKVEPADAKELSTLPTEKGSPVGDETSEPETHQPEAAVDLSGVPGSVGNILIRKSPTADTRTCDFANVSKGTLLQSSHQHINDVRNGLLLFTAYMENAARNHDWDKITFIDDFHADFVTGFDKASWWFNHRYISRHHLAHEDGIPEDVNLMDVLEYIVDCVMAGMARSGDVYELKMSPELLKVAFNNTINLLKSKVEVIEE